MRNKPFLSLRRYNFFGNSIRKSRGLTEDEAVGGGGVVVRARGTTFCFGSLMDSLDDCKQVGCRIMVLFSSVSTILFSFILFSHRGPQMINNRLSLLIHL